MVGDGGWRGSGLGEFQLVGLLSSDGDLGDSDGVAVSGEAPDMVVALVFRLWVELLGASIFRALVGCGWRGCALP